MGLVIQRDEGEAVMFYQGSELIMVIRMIKSHGQPKMWIDADPGIVIAREELLADKQRKEALHKWD